MNRWLTWVLMFTELGSGRRGDDGLAHDLFVSTDNRRCAASAGRGLCDDELLAGKGG